VETAKPSIPRADKIKVMDYVSEDSVKDFSKGEMKEKV
jgi:hypothetical protein